MTGELHLPVGKPVVRYGDYMPVELGARAWLVPIDHPLVPDCFYARTGKVIAIHAYMGGQPLFETTNTMYVPGPCRGWSGIVYRNNSQCKFA
jgi:hypothetical protein